MSAGVDLARLAQVVGGEASARQAAAALRAAWPEVRVSVLEASDLRGETPVLRTAALDVHLMATDGHCWQLTSEPLSARAVVLSEREG